MDELFDSVSRPSNLQCQWQDGCPIDLSSVRLTIFA